MSDSNPHVDSVRAILADHPDPETGRPMGTMKQVGNIEIKGQEILAEIALTTHSLPIAQEVCEAVAAKVTAKFPGYKVQIRSNEHRRPPARQGQSGLRVKSVIVVGSGKGGVGKSTVAASIAISLQRFGCQVGLMDADVYGPSIPQLLGLTGRPSVTEDKRIEPIRAGKMPVMSMGFLVEPDQAVIWRGPMLHGSINQFLGETQWSELDYLIIDMPPGTGDVALTLSQSVAIAGAVIVCTPQQVALLDAIKAISMFRKVKIPVLGIVENMSGFLCPDNGKTYDIFGRGGARDKAEELDLSFLGALPIDIKLRVAGDEGRLGEVIEEDAQARAPIDAVVQAMVRNLASKTAAAPPKPSLPML